jgi:hypothetical protein
MIKKGREAEMAVSPVVGVILMVAVTVIIAAVIGTFVLGAAEGTRELPQAGVTVDEVEGKSLTVDIKDPGNLDRIEVIMPEGQDDLKNEISGNSCKLCSSGWPTEFESGDDPRPPGGELIVGDWKIEDKDTGSNVGKFVNEDPAAGDRIKFSEPAGEVFVFGGDSDNQNLVEGDVITIVGFIDGDRSVLREYTVPEEIDLEDCDKNDDEDDGEFCYSYD